MAERIPDIDEVYMKEAGIWAKNHGNDVPTPQQLFEHLQGKGIFDVEYMTKEGVKAKPTIDKFNLWVKDAQDLCIVDDGELIPEVPSDKQVVEQVPSEIVSVLSVQEKIKDALATLRASEHEPDSGMHNTL